MNDRATLRYDRAVRMKVFGANNAADFAAASVATSRFTENSQLIQAVVDAKAGQTRGRDTGKGVLLDALRTEMRNIARTARSIALTEPGFADDYRIPDSPGEGVLLTAADAFVNALSRPGVAAKFTAREVPASFVTDLKADVKAIRDYKENTQSERDESVEATAAIERLIKRSGEIEQELTAIMHNKYGRSNPDKLRAWLSAAHLERLPRREKSSEAGGTPPANPPTPTTPPAAPTP